MKMRVNPLSRAHFLMPVLFMSFAGEDIKKDILKSGIRRLERDTGVSHHTLDKILKGENVLRKTLAKIIKQIRL